MDHRAATDADGGLAPFETARVSLRPIATDDVDLLFELHADREVMRFINGGEPESRGDVEAAVQASIDSRWVAFDRGNREFIGWFGLRPSDDEGLERELGYRLRRAAWGRGYATEVAKELINVAFDDLGARRLWAQTMAANTRSRRVLARVGLRYVRTFYAFWPPSIAGAEFGDVEYELRL